jgi:hypothetical protein
LRELMLNRFSKFREMRPDAAPIHRMLVIGPRPPSANFAADRTRKSADLALDCQAISRRR